LFDPQVWNGTESYILSFAPGGTLSSLYVVFGVPTTHGAQTVLSVSGPADAEYIATPPYGEPIFQTSWLNVAAGTFSDTNNFVVQLSRTRVNPAILRTNTWADMSTLSTNWTQWLAADGRCESTNPAIVSFVQQSLPANYRTTMTPYDTARSLHQTVTKTLTYQEPPPAIDAVGVLQDGIADCGGFAALLTACLRNVGIPARCISGFRQGDDIPHVRVEFHLPGTEWIIADPTDGNTNDPTGTYAYDFGITSDSDRYVAVDAGDAHVLSYNTFEFIQIPNYLWSGDATVESYTPTYALTATPSVAVEASPSSAGTVSGEGAYTAGTSVQISASANSGWTFTGWSDGNTQDPRMVTVPAGGTNYIAIFAQPSSSINVSGDLAFGNVTTGSMATATLTISDPGDVNLTVSSISYPDGFSGAFSGTIPAGGSQNVTVTFAPPVVDSFGGTITVNSDATEGTNTITASGTGVAMAPPTVATPTITPDGGDLADSVKVTLKCVTPKAVIYYTTDGSAPTTGSPKYKSTITLTNSATINAVAFAGTNGPSDTATASFTISTPSITTTGELPSGTVGDAYSSVTLQATGGTAPYKWSLAPKSKLPTGLKLSSTGTISGKPTKTDSTTITVKVTDAKKGTAEQSFAVTIN